MVKVKSIYSNAREEFDKKLEERLNWLTKKGYRYENIKIDKVHFSENEYYALTIAYKEGNNP